MGKYKHIVAVSSLFILVFILFGGTMRHQFNSDDYLFIYHVLRNPTDAPADGLAQFVRPSWGIYYRPVIKLFLEASVRFFGLWAGGYHVVSLLCYGLLCIEVYLIGLLLTDRWHVAAAAAAVFLTSVSHGEAIFWIASLNGVVENILTLASLILFILWRQKGKAFLRPLSVLFFVLALLTKESAISLPIILVFYDFLLGGKTGLTDAAKRAAKSCWPFVLVGILFVLLRSVVMKQADLPPPLVTFEWRMLVLGPWHALIMTLSPVNWAHVLYSFRKLVEAPALLCLVTAVAALLVTVVPLVFRQLRTTFLLWWILAGAAPLFALGLAPSERHVVFSSAGAAILVSTLLFKLSEHITRGKKPISIGLGCILVTAFAVPSFSFLKQTQTLWKNASTIANDIVEKTIIAYPAPESDSTFFFLNVPDSIGGAFVFRFDNLEHALRIYYEDDSIEVVRASTFDRVPQTTFSDRRLAYFRIGAMGGHIYLPEKHSQGPRLPKQWLELEQMGILTKNSRYIEDWRRYAASPYLIYTRKGLMTAPPDKLKELLEGLYSRR